MNMTTSRPTALWIGLGMLIAYIPLSFIAIMISRSESVLVETGPVDVVIDIAEMSFVGLSLIVASWALATRRLWGRWLIALPLAYLIGIVAYDILFFESEYADKENLLIGALMGLSPLVAVILLVSVGSTVKTYFSSSGPSDKES